MEETTETKNEIENEPSFKCYRCCMAINYLMVLIAGFFTLSLIIALVRGNQGFCYILIDHVQIKKIF